MPAGPTRRIALIGAECSGKTALARALAERLPGCLVGEVLRDFVEREGRAPTREEQAAVLTEQQAREDAVALSCALPWLVADPAPLMTAVYSRLYFGDSALVTEAADAARGYEQVVWCDIDLPWVPDGRQRDGVAFRERADTLIAELVRDELVPRGIPVIRATGSLPARVAAVGRAWQP